MLKSSSKKIILSGLSIWAIPIPDCYWLAVLFSVKVMVSTTSWSFLFCCFGGVVTEFLLFACLFTLLALLTSALCFIMPCISLILLIFEDFTRDNFITLFLKMWFQEEKDEKQWTFGREVLLMSSNDVINWLTSISNQLMKQLAYLKQISETITISASSSNYTPGINKYSRIVNPQNK